MRSSFLCVLLVISAAAVPGIAQPIEQMPGWPINTPGYHSGFRGMAFADLDSNGDLEVLLSDAGNQYASPPILPTLCAWDYQGDPMPGFPVTLAAGGSVQPPSVGDLDGDGDLEIVVLGSISYPYSGALYAFDHLGVPLSGFPVLLSGSMWAHSPVLVDLDGDGQLEILACEAVYPPYPDPATGYIHVCENDGTEWTGNWPVNLGMLAAATPAAGDVDGNGTVEICVAGYNSVFLLNTDGTIRTGWPYALGSSQTVDRGSPVLADIDGEGDREIVFAASDYNPETWQYGSVCYVLHNDGTVFSGWPQIWWGGGSNCTPTVTDLEGDGNIEILCGTGGVAGDSPCFWVWDINGNVRSGFPYMNSAANGGWGSDGPLTVADIDGDGTLEIFADARAPDYTTGMGRLFGVDANGDDLPGFPLVTVGSTWNNGATIGDVDGDGDYELGVISNVGYPLVASMNANLFTLPGSVVSPTTRDWLTYHGSPRRDGVYPAVGAECPGDVNGDGKTDLSDLGILLASYNQCPGDPYYDGRANLNDDDGTGCVNLADLGVLLSGYGCGT